MKWHKMALFSRFSSIRTFVYKEGISMVEAGCWSCGAGHRVVICIVHEEPSLPDMTLPYI